MLYHSVERFVMESCFSFISFSNGRKNKDERFFNNFETFFPPLIGSLDKSFKILRE